MNEPTPIILQVDEPQAVDGVTEWLNLEDLFEEYKWESAFDEIKTDLEVMWDDAPIGTYFHSHEFGVFVKAIKN